MRSDLDAHLLPLPPPGECDRHGPGRHLGDHDRPPYAGLASHERCCGGPRDPRRGRGAVGLAGAEVRPDQSRRGVGQVRPRETCVDPVQAALEELALAGHDSRRRASPHGRSPSLHKNFRKKLLTSVWSFRIFTPARVDCTGLKERRLRCPGQASMHPRHLQLSSLRSPRPASTWTLAVSATTGPFLEMSPACSPPASWNGRFPDSAAPAPSSSAGWLPDYAGCTGADSIVSWDTSALPIT